MKPKFKPLPSHERLKQLFDYCPHTGSLIWKIDASSRRKKGEEAGTYYKGHIKVGIEGEQYKAHRIVWKLIHGVDPGVLHISHWSHDATDNRLQNLTAINNPVRFPSY